MTNKQFIVENMGFRVSQYHPKSNIQIGRGNPDANVVIVQPHTKMPDRDSITGALKNFGMLDDAYRATIEVVEGASQELNRAYLIELIDIIKPLIVVACGPEVMSVLRQRKVRSFKGHAGKKFSSKDLTRYALYATLNPMDYGFARAPRALKAQGKSEWTKLSSIYTALKEKAERERWAC